jgi:hypothetical protein
LNIRCLPRPTLPMNTMRTSSFVLAVALCAASLVAQQRPVIDVSPAAQAHSAAKISPDGLNIAFRAGNNLSVVDSTGRSSRVLVSGSNLGTFIWSPLSLTVFLVDGNQISAASIRGGTTSLATVPGQSVEIFDVDSTGAMLYGVRYDPAATTYHVFSLTTGTGALTDLIASMDRLGDVHVDPTDTWILYTQQGTAPFSPVSLLRAQVDGQNISDLLGTPVGMNVEGPDWVDAGDTAVCGVALPASGPQIVRIDGRTQTMTQLTNGGVHRNPIVSADRNWVVCEAVDGVGGNGPTLVPTNGSSGVHLFARQPYTYTGAPTIDASSSTVVFSAQRRDRPTEMAKLWRIDLDGEIRVTPRAEINSVITFSVPTSTGEVAALFLGQRGNGFTLPGINYEFVLGAAAPLIAFGPGSNGSWDFTLPLPNLPFLQGLRIDFQGFRVDPGTNVAEFTRFGGLSIY